MNHCASSFTSDSAKEFLKQCSQLNSAFHQEGSIKIQPNSVLSRRILKGFEKQQQTDQQWLAFFDQLHLPHDAQAYLANKLKLANTILCAIEEGKVTNLKVYLEFWEYLVQLINQGTQGKEAFALNLGIKWNPSKPDEWVKDTYWCYPMLNHSEICQKLDQLLQDNSVLFNKVLSPIIADTVNVESGSDLIYLEVSNGNSLRRSFDINCYKKELLVEDIVPTMSSLLKKWEITSEFNTEIEPFLKAPLGHISGGINRQNEPFFTLYYELP